MDIELYSDISISKFVLPLANDCTTVSPLFIITDGAELYVPELLLMGDSVTSRIVKIL